MFDHKSQEDNIIYFDSCSVEKVLAVFGFSKLLHQKIEVLLQTYKCFKSSCLNCYFYYFLNICENVETM